MLYLLHFSKPLGDVTRPHMSASHYLGFCGDSQGAFERRIEIHQSGKGPSITAAAVKRGITLDVVWTSEGSRSDERRMKNAGHYARRCCICLNHAKEDHGSLALSS